MIYRYLPRTRHVHFVYGRTNRNQRLTAKLLGISRSILAWHLLALPHDEASGSDSRPDHIANEADLNRGGLAA